MAKTSADPRNAITYPQAGYRRVISIGRSSATPANGPCPQFLPALDLIVNPPARPVENALTGTLARIADCIAARSQGDPARVRNGMRSGRRLTSGSPAERSRHSVLPDESRWRNVFCNSLQRSVL